MARVELNLLGKPFPVQCENGDEARVEQLAAYVEGRLQRLSAHEAGATDNRLLMLCCLMLTDEIFELKAQRSRLGHPSGHAGGTATEAVSPELEATLVAAVEDLTGRLQGLAARLAG